MMQSLYRFLKTTLVGGLVVLVPVAVCAYIIAAVVKAVLRGLAPIAELLPAQDPGGIGLIGLMAIAIVVAVCFLFGLLVRTAGGRALGGWVEERLFNLLPGYELIKRVTQQFAGTGEETLGTPVAVRLGDSQQIGFLVEELTPGQVTVFIPAAPALTFGAVHIVPAERVEKLSAKLTQVVDCISKIGCGSSRLLSAPRRPIERKT
jgi:uncharacterized membrane protein